jgi:hypothetical protein
MAGGSNDWSSESRSSAVWCHKRAGSPFVAFAVEADQGVLAQVEVADAQISGFLGPCPGVVEEQQQHPVSQGEGPSRGRRWSSCSTSSRSRKCVSAGADRLMGMAATSWQTWSISGQPHPVETLAAQGPHPIRTLNHPVLRLV